MDWNYWLGRKYDLLGQNANADTTRADATMIDANANANLNTVRAGLLPKQTAADIAESTARTHLTDVNATLAPGLAKASEAANYGSGAANQAQGLLYGAQTAGENQASSALGKALGGDSNVLKVMQMLRGFGLQSASNSQ